VREPEQSVPVRVRDQARPRVRGGAGVWNFISLAGPQAGQHGLPLQDTALPPAFRRLLTSSLLPRLRPLFLCEGLQTSVSFSNMWR
jgi:hypothetical protein